MALGFATLTLIIEETKRLRAFTKTYRQLFGSQGVVDVLVGAAKTTAGLIQQSFLETIILSMSRMLDPAKMGKFENLSIEAIVCDLPPRATEFERLLDDLRRDLKTIRGWRDKFYAHRDAETAYSVFNAHYGEEPMLDGLTGIYIVEAAERTCKFIAGIENAIGLSNVLQNEDIEGPDGDLLIQALQKG